MTQHTLPNNAKQVFQGEIFSIYQWEQQMFDGSVAVFERASRADTVIVVAITKEQKFVVLNQEQPTKPSYLSCPGGRVEMGEEPMYAAKRELLEETGYEAGEIELWKVEQPIGKVDWSVYVFIAKNCEKTAEQKLDIGEKIQVNLVDLPQFVDMCLNEKIKEPELCIEFLRAKAFDRLETLIAEKFSYRNHSPQFGLQ